MSNNKSLQTKPRQQAKQKPEAYNGQGQPKIRVELSLHRIHSCGASEFLAWVRQQEGKGARSDAK
jgi:hypothetical protein